MGNGSPEELGEPAKPKAKPPLAPTEAELRKRFFFKPPRDDKAVENHQAVSSLSFELALELTKICPPGRQLSLALTALEEVRMRANAAIAVDDPRD